METFIPLLVLLIVVAALLREDSVLVVFYLLAGVYLFGLWWSRNAFKHVSFRRVFVGRVFYGQKITIQIELFNRGWLPVVWLKIHESLPLELISPNFFQSVVTLRPRGRTVVDYTLSARRRGYYRLGPLLLDSGDLLGMTQQSAQQVQPDYVIVYPKIVPLSVRGLPSNSPFGSLRERRPIFEDPVKVRGKRDYVPGDSLRRVDWKATAALGRMQVKCFEPSIALETCLVLNLNPEDYEQQHFINSAELAVVAAASLANWVVQNKGLVGFSTNGLDPQGDPGSSPKPLPPRRAAGALMQILDVLARIRTGETFSCAKLLQRASAGYPWGTTLLLITSLFDEALLDELFSLQRRGLSVVVVAVGVLPNQKEMHNKASHFGIPVYSFQQESDLEVWISSG
jgi:uncharacterized protein (DUF58 family)